MNEIPPLNTANLLKRYGLRADKSLGQNFLQDPLALEKIVSAAEIQATDSVLEIGPGLGSLTRYLAVSAKEVVAVELDGRLLPPLQEVVSGYTNIEIVQGDMLKISPTEIIRVPDQLEGANIPATAGSTPSPWRAPRAARAWPCGTVRDGQSPRARTPCAWPWST